MKQAIYIILVGLCLAVCPRVHAQGFTPSTTYKQIQYSSYSASGLHLQSDAFDRTHTRTPRLAPIGTMQVGTATQTAHSSSLTPHGSKLTTHSSQPAFVVGAWKGQITNVGSTVPDAVKHKLPFKPGNPVDVPIGNVPWLLLSLIALAYVVFLAGRVHK